MPRISHSAALSDVLSQDRKCCGVVEEAAYRAQSKRANKPQPWIVLKFMVFVTLGIMGYAAYVYIGRLCVPFIKSRLDRRGTGIALLVVFLILFCWMLWSYARIIFTSPGYARDHVPTTHQPLSFRNPPPPSTFTDHSVRPVNINHFQEPLSNPRPSHKNEPSLSTTLESRLSPVDSVRGHSYEEILLRSGTEMTNSHAEEQRDSSVGVQDTNPASATVEKPVRKRHCWFMGNPSRPRTYVSRRPPTTAVLLAENRYCARDSVIKPYRAHHCRNCGTCVLKYDHHCPWIGQCVGARNHKFFLNFTQAAVVCCTYIFATLLVYTIHDAIVLDAEIDPQKVVIIALAGLFAIFTGTLTIAHTLLMLKSQTTIESMIIQGMKRRESESLNKAFSCCDFRGKWHIRREWDMEWGDLDTEANIWWLGSKRKGWEDVMGLNKLGWLLPIGRSLNDGLTYPVNPRFDDDGRWRRRSEWPSELR
ncbi:hypothetical protein AMATHDRAFT_145711 [Amanita thiersii Skay4041]|uniref:Palmitoyltransferase n=1 Tax=Amanita thiersii Skay4041 TaxID=703135 RepID=A0A2A9NRA0_9AGAR|nr:hypothetical protein AMATHDRAFT_145711 [Amanita thiersii Skay4041]